jgi:succinate dehydrogenase / fumarate reductase flavoprotein subunit
MGGIPTNNDGQVLSGSDRLADVVPGFYAVGECACVSVHGANRLGTNSLLDLVVFGRRVGMEMARVAGAGATREGLPDEPERRTRDLLDGIMSRTNGEKAVFIRNELQETMMKNVSVFRNDETLAEALEVLPALRARAKCVVCEDKGRTFNTDILDAIEIGLMVDYAEAIAACARNRTESRGAHSREDHPTRDDTNWLKHTLFSSDGAGQFDVAYKDVVLGRFEPKERKY